MITKNTRFGPYPGKPINPRDKSSSSSSLDASAENNQMWEIFTDGRLSHLIDGKGSKQSGKQQQQSPASHNNSSSSPKSTISSSSQSSGNSGLNQWMLYVNCARFAQEQNLIAVQSDGEIYYEVCKDIAQGQELLVWYGDSYLQFMGIPVSLKEMSDEINEETTESKFLIILIWIND